jgi:glutamate dehydrogenase (NADP+)
VFVAAVVSHGGYYVLEKVIKEYWKKKSIEGCFVAIQRFGKVGYWIVEKCCKESMNVVVISNEHGGIYCPTGLDVEECRELLGPNSGSNWNAVIAKYPGSYAISNEDLLKLDVDVLVSAAVENVITEHNAKDIRANIVLELANGPTTTAGDEILSNRVVWVVPDIIANAGGVIVSYYEWLVNRHDEEKTHEQIMMGLKSKMQDATDKMMYRHLEKGMSLRTAAYVLALKRIGEAVEAMGIKNFFSLAKANY